MIYIATVHWVDPKWIQPQADALRRCVDTPYRVFANLEGLKKDSTYEEQFYYVEYQGGSHPEKLNHLAEEIAEDGDADDLLVFLDGDAFPIRPLDVWLGSLLQGYQLAAVRRAENAGDLQPHPCFCVTTVGFWREIKGDWRLGPWTNAREETVSDVGGKLLAILQDQGIVWRDILRSNTTNLHPVFYGIYGGHIYHHGAGFRPPVTRVDDGNVQITGKEDYVYVRTHIRGKAILEFRPRHARRLLRAVRQGFGAKKLEHFMRQEQVESEEIYQQICADSNFYQQFEV